MKKLIAFDLDGTLADSKSPITDRMGELLTRLLERFEVCVMSGGKYEQFQKQLISNLKAGPEALASLHIMPTCGTRYLKFDKTSGQWKEVYAENFEKSEKEKISSALEKATKELGFWPKDPYGEVIEDRGSQISFSALGQDIVDVLGAAGVKQKEAWDPTGEKKQAIRRRTIELIPEFEVRAGGTTTIDVTKLGIDKAYGMRKMLNLLSITEKDVLFMGDKLMEGGNDYPVKAMGIDSIEVSHWQDTAIAVETILYMAGDRS